MTPDQWQSLTWQVARTSGFVAIGLLTASVAMGLVLSLKWKSTRYPRFVTTEVHRFITLLSLVFIAVHGVAIAVDPWIGMTPLEVLLPMLSHYRPTWVAFGIVAGYLALAVYLSERIRGRIGYQRWHQLHLLAFVVWAASIVHGLGAGSDSRSPWALAIYAGSALLVGGLLLLRLRPAPARPTPARPSPASAPAPAAKPTAKPVASAATAATAAQGPTGSWAWSPPARTAPAATPATPATPRPAPAAARPAPARVGRPSLKPLLAIPLAIVAAVTIAWTAGGPLAAGWSTAAGGGPAHSVAPTPTPSPTPEPVTPIGLPFQARLSGTVDQSADAVTVAATFTGDAKGHLDLRLPTQTSRDQTAPMTLTVDPTGAVCTGELTYADGREFGGTCTLKDGKTLQVQMELALDQAGALIGVIQVGNET
ncbi:MAG: ferric reductase-like transmembrane domain-containing protein [Chloroflexota bacterium]